MSGRRHTHPLYYLVGVLGVAFTVTACAYGVMSFRSDRGGDAYGRETSAGLLGLMREHGGKVLGAEIAALAIAAVAAMAADGRATRRVEAESIQPSARESTSHEPASPT
ncbi:MAG: hypothetical protein DCC68_02415 [Planctomycetota bacterium]|nr:MAG: hypothetical protein DCC68_02415 [Planctomycetota bacterium]